LDWISRIIPAIRPAWTGTLPAFRHGLLGVEAVSARGQKCRLTVGQQSFPLRETPPVPAYSTSHGQCWNIDALEGLKKLADDSVDLIVTSPPFALRRRPSNRPGGTNCGDDGIEPTGN